MGLNTLYQDRDKLQVLLSFCDGIYWWIPQQMDKNADHWYFFVFARTTCGTNNQASNGRIRDDALCILREIHFTNATGPVKCSMMRQA